MCSSPDSGLKDHGDNQRGPSTSRPPVLDCKNYSYWKPRMIFFIKTLDGKAWRALVACYDPPMIIVDGVSVPKPEVDWTDAEEQASVGNARALNTIFNGVDQNVFNKFLQYNQRSLENLGVSDEESGEESVSDEESGDSRDDDGSINAFTIRITDKNTDDESKCFEESKNDELTIEKLEALWKEDREARAIQKERIQDLIEKNETIDTTDDAWYFDNGCSRHMIRNRSYFTNLNDCVTGHVTFGDGAKEKSIAKGNVDNNNLPCLNDVRYVDRLKANMISISELCDQGYKVSFDDVGCVVMNKENQICMSGKRQTDNCYHWNSNMSDTCQLTRSDQTWLWHKKLGHVSMRGLEKIIKNEAIVGIPNLDVNGNFFCGDCQIGKQTRTSHKSLKECYTNRVLELLHMNLMGPMQTESLGGKREYRQKWDTKSEQGIFFGYSQNSCAYRVFNNISGSAIKTINVVINDLDSAIKQINNEEDETPNMSEARTTSSLEVPKADNPYADSDKSLEKSSKENITKKSELIPSADVKKNHPTSSIIGDPSARMQTRRKEKIDYMKMVADLCYISTFEPSTVNSALRDEYWLNAMQEELLQFRRNNVWTLVSKPEGVNVIGTKWVFKNKIDEAGCVTKNKARLVALGYTQVEGIDFDETFASVA
ncbi:putative mitochondrial protein [Cucumis melo var. makuwa]|uniref:Mitochondrial protein n=1 Tax=Cucumis melo var. makuwa TaxID=1194695 RepID=A0A5A7VNR0_CUCMM|nr:putative mitochondrial protein [Cucumis melo var. makuwa]